MKQKEEKQLTEMQKTVLALLNAGFSCNAIARKLKMSPGSIHYILAGRKGKYRKFKGIRHLSTENT